MGPSNSGCLSFGIVFHFHGSGRKFWRNDGGELTLGKTNLFQSPYPVINFGNSPFDQIFFHNPKCFEVSFPVSPFLAAVPGQPHPHRTSQFSTKWNLVDDSRIL